MIKQSIHSTLDYKDESVQSLDILIENIYISVQLKNAKPYRHFEFLCVKTIFRRLVVKLYSTPTDG